MRIVFLGLLLAGGCASLSSYHAPPCDAELEPARELYIAKCANCHQFYHPDDYSFAEWHDWMDKMADKSHLDKEQYSLISKYLNSFRGSKTGVSP